ncbi:hypothetical protein V1514DRAFT_332417 [Lipomyces japonicus]|uniref:uncharacterized protein n=1 Tax=Lipomyces japonicus TaxID=56871 RepID=UPI0034CF463E
MLYITGLAYTRFTLVRNTMPLNWGQLYPYDVYGIRSQRDLTLNVSMNQNVWPAVNLNSVLFDTLNYTYDAMANIPALVTRGASRLFINLYWNSKKNQFQFCPFVEDSTSNSTVTDSPNVNDLIFSYQNRVYACNSTMTVANFLQDIVKNQVILPTDNNLWASVIILTFNLRSPTVAQIANARRKNEIFKRQDDEGPVTSDLVSASSLRAATSTSTSVATTTTINPKSNLGVQIHEVFGDYAYTPSQLTIDRSVTGLTWNESGISNTGWPLLENVLFKTLHRILFSFGEMDIGLDVYDTSVDQDYIFDRNDIPYSGTHVVNYDASFSSTELSEIASPVCSFNNMTKINISGTNITVPPHWLLAQDSSNLTFTADSIRKYLQCGFSPVLNATIAPINSMKEYVISSLSAARWSWAPGQPTEISNSTATAISAGGVVRRCAVLTSSGWQVDNCFAKYRVACRVAKSSYNWTLSDKSVTYYNAPTHCIGDSVFSLPRTAVQNTMLQLLRNNEVDNEPIWIDFNSIAQPNCWVSGGSGAQCTYATQHRILIEVVVPAVAAVIIAVLLARM